MAKRRTVCAAAALVFCAALGLYTGAFGQDPVAVDPSHHKVEFENVEVRVLRINFGPGETSVMHSHPCLIAIGVTNSSLLFHFPDGSTRNAELKVGQVVVAKPTTHQPENQTSEPSQVIVVELKSGNCERSKKTAGSPNEVLSLPTR
jgi:quercetin dioxygenase-like cupin family protein